MKRRKMKIMEKEYNGISEKGKDEMRKYRNNGSEKRRNAEMTKGWNDERM